MGVVIIVLVVTGWSYGARQLRVQTLSLRNRDFLEAARVRGERRSYIIVFEVLPTMISLIIANFLGAALFAVLTAAGLQFIGLGDPSSLSWGTMLHWAKSSSALQTGQEWWAIAPGICVALLGAAFALLNYAFDEISNPALRRVRSMTVLEVRDLSVEFTTDRGCGARGRPRRPRPSARRVRRHRRRVRLRQVDLAVRDRPAARAHRRRSPVAASSSTAAIWSR